MQAGTERHVQSIFSKRNVILIIPHVESFGLPQKSRIPCNPCHVESKRELSIMPHPSFFRYSRCTVPGQPRLLPAKSMNTKKRHWTMCVPGVVHAIRLLLRESLAGNRGMLSTVITQWRCGIVHVVCNAIESKMKINIQILSC